MPLLADLVDLVLPRACAGCGEPATLLCPGCRSRFDAPALGLAPPDPCPAGLPPVWAGAAYDGVVREVLLAHKERGRLALVRPLAELLFGAVAGASAATGTRGALLVPVPSARSAVRARGHDHARRLAVEAGRQTGLQAAALLRPTRRVADQSGLSTGERAANLRGALVARQALTGVTVLVVDDVVTTGATLVEAARALRAAGAEVRGAAVVAATPRRRRSGTCPERGVSVRRDEV